MKNGTWDFASNKKADSLWCTANFINGIDFLIGYISP
jgi:hypothetical protein